MMLSWERGGERGRERERVGGGRGMGCSHDDERGPCPMMLSWDMMRRRDPGRTKKGGQKGEGRGERGKIGLRLGGGAVGGGRV